MRTFFLTLFLLILGGFFSILQANDTLVLLSGQIPSERNNANRILANSPPSVTASNSTLTLPENSTVVTSTAVAANGIASTKWTKLKSPGQTLKTIVFLGSSTSIGFGLTSPQTNSFVGRTINYYNSQGLSNNLTWNVHNRALGGSNVFAAMPDGSPNTSNQGPPDRNRNITWAIANGADIVVVNFPTNKYYIGSGGLSITEIMYAYRTILNTAVAAGRKCYITTTQPRTAAPDFDNLATWAFLKQIRDSILLQFGQYAIDFYSPIVAPGTSNIDPEYNYGDNVHVNSAGHLQLFNRLVAANVFESFANCPALISTPSSNNTEISPIVQPSAHKFQVSVIDTRGHAANAISTVTVNPCSGNTNYWIGIVSNEWGNPLNWSCGTVPVATTNVIVSQGNPYYPTINSNITVRSITISNNVELTISPGIQLTVTGN